jgi:hypothetical protein
MRQQERRNGKTTGKARSARSAAKKPGNSAATRLHQRVDHYKQSSNECLQIHDELKHFHVVFHVGGSL